MNAISSITSWITNIIDQIFNIVNALPEDLFEVGRDLLFYAFEQVISLSGTTYTFAMEMLPDFNFEGRWDNATEPLLQVLSYIGIAECIGIIVTALMYRFARMITSRITIT